MNKEATTIQKAQNATKIILFLFYLFTTNNAISQEKLNGSYSCLAPLQEHYNIFSFNEKGQFEYHIGASLGDDYYGKGEYKFTDNQLILNYNKTELIQTSHHVSKIWTNNTEIIDIHFNIFDIEGNPLPYTNIIYRDSLSKNGYNGVMANEKGITLLNLKKDRNNLQFEISNLGFNNYKFSIDKNYNYKVSIYLQKDGFGLPILNQIDTLEVVKKKTKYFTVKDKDGKITTWRKIEG